MVDNFIYCYEDDKGAAKEIGFCHPISSVAHLDVAVVTPDISDVEFFRKEDLIEDMSEVYRNHILQRYGWYRNRNDENIAKMWSPFRLERASHDGSTFNLSYAYVLPCVTVYEVRDGVFLKDACHGGFYSQAHMDKVACDISNAIGFHATPQWIETRFSEGYDLKDLFTDRMYKEDSDEINRLYQNDIIEIVLEEKE